MLDDLLRDSARLERLHHVPQFVLVGRPNAGKSTLLNALAGEAGRLFRRKPARRGMRSRRRWRCARGVMRLIDVAGIEESQTSGEIERQMQERAMAMVETADCGDSGAGLRAIQCADLESSHVQPIWWFARKPIFFLPPRPVLRERAGVRVRQSSASTNDMATETLTLTLSRSTGRGDQEGILVSAPHWREHPRATSTSRPTCLRRDEHQHPGHQRPPHPGDPRRPRRAGPRASGSMKAAQNFSRSILRDALDALAQILGQVTPGRCARQDLLDVLHRKIIARMHRNDAQKHRNSRRCEEMRKPAENQPKSAFPRGQVHAARIQ